MVARNPILICTALLTFLVGVAAPVHNWDMIGYVASAYHEDGYSGAELSRRTYDDIRREVSAPDFAELIAGDYGAGVFKHPAALEQHLPFYSIRVAYVELVRLLKRTFGVDYPEGTYLVSAFFAALSVFALGAILNAWKIPILALPLIVAAAGYGHLARLSTPDALASFFALWAVYCMSSKSRLLFVIAAVLPVFRTDYVVLSALLMGYTCWRGNKALSGLSLMLSGLTYMLVNRSHDNYGWLTLFNFSFIQITPFPAQLVPSHRLADYVVVYYSSLLDLLTVPNFLLVICLVAVFVVALHRSVAREYAGRHALFGVPFAFIVLRLALFPALDDRFYVFPASLILAGTLGILLEARGQRAGAA